MYSNRPDNYTNPFKLLLDGIENDQVYSRQSDIIYSGDEVTALISSHWWPNNPGNVIVIPNEEYENIYDLPDDLTCKVHLVAKRVAIAMKEVYECDGVSTRQHNEPDGDQDVWHYHLHVFPRYEGDDLYLNYDKKRETTPEERKPYAKKLREYFKHNPINI